MYNKKCILIVGATGFIGRELYLSVKKSEDVYTVSRSQSSSLKESNHFAIDLLTPGSIQPIINSLSVNYKKIEIQFLAGLTSVEDSYTNPFSGLLSVVNSYAEMLNSIRHVNSSIVFASSGSVYDGREDEHYHESSLLRPISPYSCSKLCCENLSIMAHESFGVDVKIARIFSVYGETMNRFFIYDVIQKLLTAKKFIVLDGDGTQVRDYLHVNEVSKGLLHIMKYGQSGEAYNLCSGVPVTLKSLANSIREILDKKHIDIVWSDKSSNHNYDRWYGEPEKLKNIGFEPPLNFEINLKKVVYSIKNTIS
jgi:nucleoside-diphosphate-sugar epimerase